MLKSPLRLAGRASALIVCAGILATGFIGFLHTSLGKKLPFGRELLSLLRIQCPLNLEGLTAAQVERSREIGVNALKGSRLAPARPALAGLNLDVTSFNDAEQWAKSRQIRCQPTLRGMRFLKCEGRQADETLTLAFNPSDRLVAIDVFRRKLAPLEAVHEMQKLSQDLSHQLGQPTETLGELSSQYFSGNSMKVSFVNYRFANYLALLTATQIPWSGGVALHEQYSSVESPPSRRRTPQSALPTE